MNFGDILSFLAHRHPHKPVLYDRDKTISFGELNIRANQLGNKLLSLGLRPNDKASLVMRNCSEYIEIVFALLKIGVIPVPINFRLVGEELAYIARNSDSKALILEEEFIDKITPIKDEIMVDPDKYYVLGGKTQHGMISYESLFEGTSEAEPPVSVDEKSCSVMCYTSGTTGKPKGAVASHKARILEFLAHVPEFKISEDDIHLVAAPLCHSGGMFLSLGKLCIGGALSIMREFEPEEALRLIDDKKATNTFMVPTMLNFILELPERTRSKYDVSSMRVIDCAGAPLPTRTKEGTMDFFHNAGLYEHYGSTECGVISLLKPDDQRKTIRSAGKPLFGVKLKLISEKKEQISEGEVGEIFVKSPYNMDGYYNKGKEGFEGEWFATGDLAKQDEAGYLYIVDRSRDMIISGGENIYPTEIEDVLYSNSKVLETAVIGVPDERWGESVTAFIVLNEGQSSSQDEIIQYCRERLAGYKIPRSVNFVPSLPKSTSGKILKRVIREEYWKDEEIKV
jgi:long-chain acyl-CoA synthetase